MTRALILAVFTAVLAAGTGLAQTKEDSKAAVRQASNRVHFACGGPAGPWTRRPGPAGRR